MDYKELLLQRDVGVATITLNRPQVMNALNQALISELVRAVNEVSRDDDVRVVVVTGTGRGFCSGLDIKEETSGGDAVGLEASAPMLTRLSAGRRGIQRIPRTFHACQKPVIAAVNGPAIGGGMDIASMADIRIASDTARFGMTHTMIARVSLDGGYYFLQRIVGHAKAMDLVLSCRIFDAREALTMGYVSSVVPQAELAATAKALAAKIAGMSPVATRLAKQLLSQAHDSSLEQALEQVEVAMALIAATSDYSEGPRAFAEKRPPKFTGR